jgi:hypothetical protein
MKNEVIENTMMEASKIYDAFVTAVALPGIFNKVAIQLVINTLQRDLEKHYSEDTPEKAVMVQYVQYLETLK